MFVTGPKVVEVMTSASIVVYELKHTTLHSY